MTIVNPKCIKCGESRFTNEETSKVDGLRFLIREIRYLEKEIESATDSQQKTILEEYFESRKKVLDDKVNKSSKVKTKNLVTFCINCGEILRTSDGNIR